MRRERVALGRMRMMNGNRVRQSIDQSVNAWRIESFYRFFRYPVSPAESFDWVLKVSPVFLPLMVCPAMAV